jgi:hypothetical protein
MVDLPEFLPMLTAVDPSVMIAQSSWTTGSVVVAKPR